MCANTRKAQAILCVARLIRADILWWLESHAVDKSAREIWEVLFIIVGYDNCIMPRESLLEVTPKQILRPVCANAPQHETPHQGILETFYVAEITVNQSSVIRWGGVLTRSAREYGPKSICIDEIAFQKLCSACFVQRKCLGENKIVFCGWIHLLQFKLPNSEKGLLTLHSPCLPRPKA